MRYSNSVNENSSLPFKLFCGSKHNIDKRTKLRCINFYQKNRLLRDQQEDLMKDMRKLPKGALIALSGLKSEINLNELKNAAIKLGWEVDFVDYTAGEPTAYIRLQTADSAKDVSYYVILLSFYFCVFYKYFGSCRHWPNSPMLPSKLKALPLKPNSLKESKKQLCSRKWKLKKILECCKRY